MVSVFQSYYFSLPANEVRALPTVHCACPRRRTTTRQGTPPGCSTIFSALKPFLLTVGVALLVCALTAYAPSLTLTQKEASAEHTLRSHAVMRSTPPPMQRPGPGRGRGRDVNVCAWAYLCPSGAHRAECTCRKPGAGYY